MIYSDTVQVPLVVRTSTPRADSTMQVAGGTPSQGFNVSEYVLLTALPKELRDRVVLAIKAQLG